MDNSIQRAENAHQLHQNIVDTKKDLTGNFLRLAYLLKVANSNKVHKKLGYDTWEQYLATPEISVSVSMASRLINIWDEFVVKYKIKSDELLGIDLSKLTEILPVIKKLDKKEEVKDWLEKAKQLGILDLKLEKKEYLTGNTTGDCKHDWYEKSTYICDKCGLREYNKPDDYDVKS